MQTIDLEHGAVRVAGALDLDRRPTGITPRRLPDWTRPQVVPVIELRITQSSGVRLELLTTSTVIELEVLLTRLHMLGRDLAPATFDLVVEGELVDSRTTEQGDVLVQDLARPEDLRRTDGEPTTLRFEGLAPTLKRCELWLPPNATAELRGLRVEDGARVLAPERSTRSRWIHHGSSISHCTEAHSPTRTWPVVAARRAQVEVLNLGFGRQCHLDPFVARTIRDEPGDVVSLKLGINVVNGDTMRERTFVPAVHGFLDTIREGKPATPILVVSPIICPCAEQIPGPTVLGANGKFVTLPGHEEIRAGCLNLSRIRELLVSVVESRRAGDRNLHYLDGLRLYGENDAHDLPDALHPSGDGYVRMGERFHDLVFVSGGPFAEYAPAASG